MTREQLIAELTHLPAKERLELLEVLVRTLRDELQPQPSPATWRSLRGLLKSPVNAGESDPEELRDQSLLHKHA